MAKKYKIKEAEDTRFVVPLLTEGNFTEINAYDYVKIRDGYSFADLLSQYYAELQKTGLTHLKLTGCVFDVSLTVDSCSREHGLSELVIRKDLSD